MRKVQRGAWGKRRKGDKEMRWRQKERKEEKKGVSKGGEERRDKGMRWMKHIR